MQLELIKPYRKENAFLLQSENGAYIIGQEKKEIEAIEITVIYVPPELRGQGIGSELLQSGIAEIEKLYRNSPIFLLAMPMWDCQMNIDQLVAWYKEHFFVPITGDNESKIMVYDPTNAVKDILSLGEKENNEPEKI